MADRSTPLTPVAKAPLPINGSLIKKLEVLLEKAKKGLVSDAVCLYFEGGNLCFTEDCAASRRMELIALAEVWKNRKIQAIEEEVDDKG